MNMGTVSFALGKSLPRRAVVGEPEFLEEAVVLLEHDDKNVRAGAAEIIEQVAVENPGMIAGFLPRLLPTLDAPEPQTRWMIIHTLGLCAGQDQDVALKAMPKTE